MGIAELDLAGGTIILRANIILYGAAASAELAETVAAEINEIWSKPSHTLRLKGISVKVVFDTSGVYNPALTPEEVVENKNPLNNFFRVEEYAGGNISFVDGLYSNTGYFKRDNLVNNSTTAAHEFGHTLGLEHPVDLDLRGKGRPGIMYPRGTITDPEFQYDPTAAPGAIGGTMNPFHRGVTQEDIDLLGIGMLAFKNNVEMIGGFTNIWHEAHLP